MEKYSIFTYSWYIDDYEKDITSIRIYGLNQNNENVCLRINDFTPYVYLELPEDVSWNALNCSFLITYIDHILGHQKPIKKQLIFKQKLFMAHIDNKGCRKKFPYLFLSFSNKNDIKKLLYHRRKIVLRGIPPFNIKIHEQDASPILQITSYNDLPTAGWINFKGKRIKNDEKITFCDHEFVVKWKSMSRHINTNIIRAPARPLIMSFDIEVNSTNPSAMPSSVKPGDKIFQISCILYRQDDSLDKVDNYLLTLGEPDPKTVGDEVEIRMFDTEHDLLLGYSEFIREKGPNIISGYNILNFDIPYMIDRAKLLYCIHDFQKQGFDIQGYAKERDIKWSSSAYGDQTFKFLDAEGRLFIDLLPIIKKDYKMSNYKLKTVSTHFIGSTKDPLSVKGIFKCYSLGIKNIDGVYLPKAKKAMGIVGKYCIQDSVLVIKLIKKLHTWIGLCEMANVCNVPIFLLHSQGQQIKVYSQMYKYCRVNNFVVEKDGYVSDKTEHFQGAYVVDPVPGVYDVVIPLDFKSLYPSIIIAKNICYSTIAPKEYTWIKDSECNIIEWEEHSGCIHDKSQRKTKPKYILCGIKKYRFLKEPKGVAPIVIQNLLDARTETRKEIKVLSKKITNDTSEEEKFNINILINVLDKRQLAYKVSANSIYGSMGVQKGYLPFMPGAMCTTAIGRETNRSSAKSIVEDYKGELIYGDTDSSYVRFPHLKTAEENWDYAIYVAKEISKKYQDPIELEFEYVIYWRFLIISKKRYMYKQCLRDGIVDENIGKKGVLLARRDNSKFIRDCYEILIMKIFDRISTDDILYYTMNIINKLCSGFFPETDFIVTKAIGDNGEGAVIPFINEKGIKKGKMGSYTVPLLSNEQRERSRQFKLKNCKDEKEYYTRCLPAVVQLAEKMRYRGQRVDTGTRLEYIISTEGGHSAKQYIKIEDATYFKNHKSVLIIDYLYYLKLMCNPFDDILNMLKDGKQNFVLDQYRIRSKIRFKLHNDLKKLFSPNFLIKQ
jgi:DNA polymerase elongation subunit (family B)